MFYEKPQLKNSLKNSRGSALIIVLVMVGVLSASALMVAQRSVALSQAQAQKSPGLTADQVAAAIAGVLSNSSVCSDGFDGAGGESGLQLYTSTGAETQNFDEDLAAASGQEISVPGIYTSGNGLGANQTVSDFKAGTDIPGADLRIERVYITSPNLVSTNTYAVKVMADIRPTSGTALGLSAREVMNLKIRTSNGVTMTGCEEHLVNSNKSVCEGMGCVYEEPTASGNSGSCTCKLQATTCLNGTYIESVSNGVPQCSSTGVVRSCASSANSFLVALDGGGREVCGRVVLCPAGTSRTGLGGAATPADCKCTNAGEVYSGGVCAVPVAVVAVAGVCGSANNSNRTSAPTTNLCSSGTASAVSGSGPWTWTCSGSGGGANASCSANLTVAVAGDCVGSWSACSVACGGGTQTYTITQPASGGAACPATHGQTQACNTTACVVAGGPPTVNAIIASFFTERWNGSSYETYAPFTKVFLTTYELATPLGMWCSTGAYGTQLWTGPSIDNSTCSYDYGTDPTYVYHKSMQTQQKVDQCYTGTFTSGNAAANCAYSTTVYGMPIEANTKAIGGICPPVVNFCPKP